MTELIDPRIEIKHIPDGEVHIIINWSVADLIILAYNYISVTDGRMGINEAKSVLRIKSQIGLKYMISELEKSLDNS